MAHQRRLNAARITAAVVLALAVGSRARGAGAEPPNYGFNFATVTHAGNAPTQTFPRPGFPTLTVGAVSHEYRISTTETTNAQWFEFVRAYAPFVNSNSWTSESFIGRDILFEGVSGGVPQYFLPPSRAQRPSEIGWAFAARFCNWSHNGQKGVGEAAADFEAGAYDMSRYLTPGWDSAHTPEAKYWIPTMDEWVKAAYWDPNKNGPAQPGYWAYPITSDAAPIAGEPGSGGQTNTGVFPAGQVRPLDVGSYPTVVSPWGLLDASGGLVEWVQNPEEPGVHRSIGSSLYHPFDPASSDQLVLSRMEQDLALRIGLRIASAVPGPMAAPALLALAALTRRSRGVARGVR